MDDTAASEEASAPAIIRLTRVELLEAQNKQLQLEKVQLELTLLTQQVTTKVGQRDQLSKEFSEMSDALTAKYGIDMKTAHIGPDGLVTPRP